MLKKSTSSKELDAAAKKLAAKDKEISRLKDSLRHREVEVGIYRELGNIIDGKLSISTVLTDMVKFALKALDTDSGTLYLVDKESKELI
ncbi:MAG: hypothetical protein KAR06_00295, partial [Deltaproteobacteria bacterium]|nr:hypothetical protein [Deltaproteobacteria bacterium]